MKQHKINDLNNFIAGWYFDDTSICDELIEFHKNSPFRHEGLIGDGINKEIKDSVDAPLDHEHLFKYYEHLRLVADLYKEKYPYCNYYSGYGIKENVLVQHYKPNGGYYGWHTERSNTNPIGITRHLVFMTYLNDVNDAGETEFFHQNLKVKPEKGLTLIWGSDWTFTHRGIPSSTEDKYIVTGWFNFI